MDHLLVWSSALALLAAVGCESRVLPGRTGDLQTGAKNFGFFPSFAATIPRAGGRPRQPLRRRRSSPSAPAPSAGGTPETDVLEVEDFVSANGLGSGFDPDGPSGRGLVEAAGRRATEPPDLLARDHNRLRRADEEEKGNNLSWLLEQDAWEKVDEAEDLDWDNIATEVFDAGVEEAPRDARDAGVPGDSSEATWRVSEDAIYQKVRRLAEDIAKRRKELELEYQVGEDGGQDAVRGSVEGSEGGSSGTSPGVSEGGASEREDVREGEDDPLDDAMQRRKRSADDEVPAVEVEGRIDMFFKSAPQSPVATVIIQKDSALPPNPPDVPPPIYFCGTKTDPSNPDSVSGEVSETVGAH